MSIDNKPRIALCVFVAKELPSLQWVEELLPPNCLRKPMFGGFAYYCDQKIVLVMFEKSGDRNHKDKTYDFELWNGCMFPTERENHAEALKIFPFLVPHPVLPKWLYLPTDTEDFERNVEDILKLIRRRSKIFGVIPKPKKKTAKAKKEDSRIDTRRPRMFSDEPKEQILTKAKKISDLKNLGPESEKAFAKAGIRTAPQFIKLGWKKTLQKLVRSNPKNCHSLYAYALIGALTNTEWSRISEQEKSEAKEFTRSLRKGKK